MEHRYFSMKEFKAFVVEATGQVKLRWLGLSGDVPSDTDSAELQRLVEEFFRQRKHRSLRKHGF
ncbi:MAG: hypothetical protein DMG54_31665 [Acidobacteria bacterium]|nr:MAG: hypothetical protein DMG54_31665 [Acidobacteriota bacterium]PYU71283.1 MAG: hypothetical protein DMG52_22785 [Acidobacteriota bacterium]